jgi:hypothetical protein
LIAIKATIVHLIGGKEEENTVKTKPGMYLPPPLPPPRQSKHNTPDYVRKER